MRTGSTHSRQSSSGLSDLVAGHGLGAAIAARARSAVARLGLDGNERAESSGRPPASNAVLVTSPHAGNSGRLARARRALDRYGIHVTDELDIEHVDRLPELLRATQDEPRLVIAAGGDGTVGSVAACLAGLDHVLGVLPLGTGNDFARSLDIPVNPRRAAAVIANGEVSTVDLGRLIRTGQPPAYFAHAATAGLNVDFAKLATRASVRARLGRLTYLAAGLYAFRERSTFTCTLEHDGGAEDLELVQLTVISAPVIGGSLGLNLRSPYPDDHQLDVIAVEKVPSLKMLLAGVFLVLGIKRPVRGVRTLHVSRLGIGSRRPVELALDGEPGGSLPGEFEALVGIVRVITPPTSAR